MDTGIQHVYEPSQGPSSILWHAKEFATNHVFADKAGEESTLECKLSHMNKFYK